MPSFAMHTALSIPLAWGRYSRKFLQWYDLTLERANPLEIKSTKYLSLSVATSIFKPPTPIDLISFSRSPVMTTIPNIPVWIIKITKALQYFPATNVKSAANEVRAGLFSSPPWCRRRLAGVLPRACRQETQSLSYGQCPRASFHVVGPGGSFTTSSESPMTQPAGGSDEVVPAHASLQPLYLRRWRLQQRPDKPSALVRGMVILVVLM